MSGFKKKPDVDDFVKGAAIDGISRVALEEKKPERTSESIKPISKPQTASKSILFKTTPALHKKIKLYSVLHETSVNQIIELAVQQFLKDKDL